ncbi:hypothetical protein ABH920_001889 [Catenulispora sp. EB89]|uniref:hypothetical protein n=1 Tax=Catenulispora sp. EB89 TaxID=3156257 RepID=UPI003513F9A5
MRLFDPGFAPEEVLVHPRHQAAQQTLVALIEDLRACEGPADGFDFQQELLQRVLAADANRNAFSQAAKLVRKGRKPQRGAPEPESGMDPSDLGTWIFEREMWERIGRQYRSIGDAMAWRAFGFDRRVILALCRNEPPGIMAGKEGLRAELERVEAAWESGSFAILHDLTNCLRIGDVTVFGPDGPPVTEEIKLNPKRQGPAQLRRIHEAREALWNGAPLPGNDPREKLYDLALPFKTHLDLLREATERAAVEGIATVVVPGNRALAVVDHMGCRNAGIADDEGFSALYDERYDPVLREAGIAARRELNINANSIDGVARDPLRAPWAIYPLHPIVCARLIGDIAAFVVETSGPVLAQALQASGVPARWVLPPGRGGELARGEVVMEMTTVTRVPIGGRVLENTRILQMQRSGLDQYLIELVDSVIWMAGVRHLFENREVSGRPWTHYRDESQVWV